MERLVPVTFPVVDGREFILTLNDKPVMIPEERAPQYDNAFGDCCPWFAGMTGFESACKQCKVSFG